MLRAAAAGPGNAVAHLLSLIFLESMSLAQREVRFFSKQIDNISQVIAIAFKYCHWRTHISLESLHFIYLTTAK